MTGDTSFESMLRAVWDFHEAAKQPAPTREPSLVTKILRQDITEEETEEFFDAEEPKDQLDALADSLYVLLGNAIAYNFHGSLTEAFWRVHMANMAKFGPGGGFRADGKVLKPPGWQPPDLSDLV